MFNKQLLAGGGRESQFVAFADFHGINVPTMADFKVP